MASWLKFTSDYDHKHESRAVTAYKAGDVVYTPTHIARVALAKGKAVETDKPTGKPTDEAGDGRRVYVEDGAPTANGRPDAGGMGMLVNG